MSLRKMCRTCGQETLDNLAYTKTKRFLIFNSKVKELTPYCRIHLLAAFQPCFTSFPNKMVVYHPSPGVLEKNYVYGYDLLSEIPKQAWFDKAKRDRQIEVVRSALEAISGKCSMCPAEAQVAYFDQRFIKWDGEWPLIDKAEPAQNLCQRCTYDEIEPALASYKGSYIEGLFCPQDGEGYFFPTLI